MALDAAVWTSWGPALPPSRASQHSCRGRGPGASARPCHCSPRRFWGALSPSTASATPLPPEPRRQRKGGQSCHSRMPLPMGLSRGSFLSSATAHAGSPSGLPRSGSRGTPDRRGHSDVRLRSPCGLARSEALRTGRLPAVGSEWGRQGQARACAVLWTVGLEMAAAPHCVSPRAPHSPGGRQCLCPHLPQSQRLADPADPVTRLALRSGPGDSAVLGLSGRHRGDGGGDPAGSPGRSGQLLAAVRGSCRNAATRVGRSWAQGHDTAEGRGPTTESVTAAAAAAPGVGGRAGPRPGCCCGSQCELDTV